MMDAECKKCNKVKDIGANGYCFDCYMIVYYSPKGKKKRGDK